MRSHLRVLALLSLSVAFAMCAPASEEEPEAEATVEADLEAIGGLREVYAAAVNAGDVDRLTDSFTEDAVVMPPNEPVVTGYEAIESWFEANFEQFTTELRVSSDEVEVVDGWAFDRGTYTLTLTPKAEGEPTEDNGKYIDILQKQPDGSWKYARSIWNSDRPFPGTEEAPSGQ